MARIWDWLGILFVVGVIYILVRPGSKAVDAVSAIGSAVVAMAKTATDIGN